MGGWRQAVYACMSLPEGLLCTASAAVCEVPLGAVACILDALATTLSTCLKGVCVCFITCNPVAAPCCPRQVVPISTLPYNSHSTLHTHLHKCLEAAPNQHSCRHQRRLSSSHLIAAPLRHNNRTGSRHPDSSSNGQQVQAAAPLQQSAVAGQAVLQMGTMAVSGGQTPSDSWTQRCKRLPMSWVAAAALAVVAPLVWGPRCVRWTRSGTPAASSE